VREGKVWWDGKEKVRGEERVEENSGREAVCKEEGTEVSSRVVNFYQVCAMSRPDERSSSGEVDLPCCRNSAQPCNSQQTLVSQGSRTPSSPGYL